MSFNTVNNTVSALATEVERRRAISSLSQDHLNGIVNLTDECDKDYWERDLGLYDAVLGLYDLVTGREIPVGSGTVQIGEVTFDAANTSVDGPLSVHDALDLYHVLTIQDHLPHALQCYGKAIFAKGASFYQGLQSYDTFGFYLENYNFNGGALAYGDTYRVLGLANDSIEIGIAESQSFLRDTNANGGALRFALTDVVPFCVGAQGHLSLNNLDVDDPDKEPGISILADTASSAGDITYLSTTLLSDDRTSMRTIIKNALNKPSGNVYQDIILDTNATPSNSLFRFRVDNVDVATLSGVGDFFCVNDLTVGDDLTVAGDTDCFDISGAMASFTGLLLTGAASITTLEASGLINANAGLDAGANIRSIVGGEYCAIGVVGGNPYFSMSSANGNSSFQGEPTLAGGSFACGTEFNSMMFYRGHSGTVTAGARIGVLGDGAGDMGSILFPQEPGMSVVKRLFVDVRGSVATVEDAGPASNVGLMTSGAHISHGVAVTEVDITNQVSLDARCAAESHETEGAVMVVRDTADSKLHWARYDGTNWEIIE